MTDQKTTISVIIPAYNEEEYIRESIVALQQNESLEIILVDNGSADGTAEIAKQLDVKVVHFPVGTISAVRNRGVLEASGDSLIFIDSDVRVTRDWHRLLPSVIAELERTPLLVTGSRYQSPAKKGFLNKYWYSVLTQYEAPYINGGHLITSRVLFENVGGFDESLETAEDHDFCKRAGEAGAAIRNNSDLIVTHDGYPQDLLGFIQRERWHGRQDFRSWKLFRESKIAWLGTLNVVLLLLIALFVANGEWILIPAYLITIYIISVCLTLYKFGIRKVDYVLATPLIFFLYICGRSLAFVDELFSKLRR